MEQAKVRLGCGKIVANKVIDKLFIFISSKVDKYNLELSSLSARLAKFARFVYPLLLLAPVVVALVCNLCMTVKIQRIRITHY